MAKAPVKTPAPASDFKSDATHISVRFAGSGSRWRAGRKFTAEPSLIAKADLSAEEIAALLADPTLAVTEITPPPAPAPAP
jgi:hypothetical protein